MSFEGYSGLKFTYWRVSKSSFKGLEESKSAIEMRIPYERVCSYGGRQPYSVFPGMKKVHAGLPQVKQTESREHAERRGKGRLSD